MPTPASPWECARLMNSDGTHLSVVLVFNNATRAIDRVEITNGSAAPAQMVVTDLTDGSQDVYTLQPGLTTVRRQPQLTRRHISTVEDWQASPFTIATG